jgi:hypothetical protein
MINFDFYHTYSYNHIYATPKCKPFLFHYTNSDVDIAIPLLLRSIGGFPDFKDITSAYGYVGPLASKDNIDQTIIEDFQTALKNFFETNNVVSAFSRLHPYITNDCLLNKTGTIVPLSNTIYIDLNEDLETQRRAYKKGVKSDISKLNKSGYEIYEDKKLDFIDTFIDIYNENMRRVEANNEYFFDMKYYTSLLKSKDFHTKLLFVVIDNIKIAGSIFVFTNNIIQYHLSGTRTNCLKNSPVRLLIDYVRLYGFKNNCKIFHLGGGVGSEEDPLFNFKAGFSKHRLRFKIWKYIVDNKTYDFLSDERKPRILNPNYFPLYRG